MIKFKCKHCGSTEYIIKNWQLKNGGVNKGVYCAKCGHWFKFISNSDEIEGTLVSEEDCEQRKSQKKTKRSYKKRKKEYKAYLNSDEWKARRIAKAKQQNYTCERCGKIVPVGFHIHHKTYEHFKNEPLSDLMFLCEDCHKEVHIALRAQENNKKKKKAVDKKTCNNCFYSQVMTYKGNNKRRVLYCNLYCRSCDDNICSKYKKGATKKAR